MATLRGTSLDDVLISYDIGDVLYGLDNNDELMGFGVGMQVYGGRGDDLIIIQPRDRPGLVVSAGFGDEGNDRLQGGVHNDRLFGGTGDDILLVSAGRDTIQGGDGQDILAFTAVLGPPVDFEGITFSLSASGAGRFSQKSVWETHTVIYSGIEGVAGTRGADRLSGNDSGNQLFGSLGDDTLRGNGGDDLLRGEDGRDVLTGGAGADLFVFDGGPQRWDIRNSADRVTDFNVGEDKFVFAAVNFSGLRADLSDNDGFIQAGTQIFGLDAGQFVVQTDRYATTLSARLIYDQDDGLLYYDANGALSGYGPVLVATIGAGLALTADNFALI